MIDYEGIVLDALADLDLSPDRRRKEFDQLVSIIQTEIGDLRRSGLPEDEIEQMMRLWAEFGTNSLRRSQGKL